jgi:glycosyltransferase involved in cell wall biosynthesis
VEVVEQFQPGLVLVIGLGKLFPKPILEADLPNARKVVLLADNEDSFDRFKGVKGISKQLKKQTLRKLYKDPVYKLAVKKADEFYAYTPSAPDVVLNYIPVELHDTFKRKVKELSLGFDKEEFYYDADLRKQKREEFGWTAEDVVLITATRITPFKNIERIVNVVNQLNEDGIAVKYFIAGFGNDLFSEKLKKYIASKKYGHQISCHQFLPHKELNELYNAADLGYWSSHIITHYEAMGTGLPIVLPDKKNVEHVIEHNVNGWKFKESDIYDTFSKAIGEAIGFRQKRDELAQGAKEKFAFTTIAKKIL